MKTEQKLTIAEIERLYPRRWVLVEETAWDEQGNPLRGVVRSQSEIREDLSGLVKEIHRRARVKTFIFYTGDKIPENLTVVL